MRLENIVNLFKRRSRHLDEVKDIEPRSLTDREVSWISEILQTNEDWKEADISKTRVIAEGPCDEGFSILLRASEPENAKPDPMVGYVGRLVIGTKDDCLVEIRLSHADRRLKELFILFVDPKNPGRMLPESWTEVSHQAFGP